MNSLKSVLKSSWLWLVLTLLTDAFFIFLIWLAKPAAIGYLSAVIMLFTALVLIVGIIFKFEKQRKLTEAFRRFLEDPEEEEEGLLECAPPCWGEHIRALSQRLREQAMAVNDRDAALLSYQEYIEEWAHGIKTPLSLATLVLDNHKDELSPYVYKRMEHVRVSIGGDVERILFYARLHGGHADYRLERLSLAECVGECLEDFKLIAAEKGVSVRLDIPPLEIVSDRRALCFILSQLLSNAFKYCAGENGEVCVAGKDEGESVSLAVLDNGSGAVPEDVPFLFDKGFTGYHAGRQTATGMGLYFAKKYAEALSLRVELVEGSARGDGFGIRLFFPKLD